MKIYSYETLDSTNEFMKNNISKFEEYDVVTAENQTLGKARRGNTWVSQKGMALFTFLVKKNENSNLDDSEYLKLPLLAGFSVIKGLKKIENLDYMLAVCRQYAGAANPRACAGCLRHGGRS